MVGGERRLASTDMTYMQSSLLHLVTKAFGHPVTQNGSSDLHCYGQVLPSSALSLLSRLQHALQHIHIICSVHSLCMHLLVDS